MSKKWDWAGFFAFAMAAFVIVCMISFIAWIWEGEIWMAKIAATCLVLAAASFLSFMISED